ncbi:MAG: hypothetical protein O7C59_04070 [Rickettsia endosymbiont of Ixodes persulcatus]|nr:hypothetical protein [Rickettsia endosymbiont of Ixodes persulcatus]
MGDYSAKRVRIDDFQCLGAMGWAEGLETVLGVWVEVGDSLCTL